jgi:predicted metal-dependent hydrolase
MKQAVSDVITVQKTAISLRYRYHRNARRLLMRLDYADSNPIIKVTIPPNCTVEEVNRFLSKAYEWLEDQIKQRDIEHQSRLVFQKSAILPLLGKTVIVHINKMGTCNHIHLCNDRLIIPEQLFQVSYIKEFLKAELLRYLEQKTKHYVQTINEEIPKVSVKELKSRYGSCTSSRRISYAAKLVFAPQEVIDYVCVHEVAHLKEMNHSQRFWEIVEKMMPYYKDHEKWLRLNGYRLNDAWKIHKA